MVAAELASAMAVVARAVVALVAVLMAERKRVELPGGMARLEKAICVVTL